MKPIVMHIKGNKWVWHQGKLVCEEGNPTPEDRVGARMAVRDIIKDMRATEAASRSANSRGPRGGGKGG